MDLKAEFRPPLWAEYAYVIFLLLALQAVLVFIGVTPVLKGEMLDTDTYMRLLRVQDLVTGHGWFNSTIERMNAPYGDVLNWTRPLDVMIAVFALPIKMFLDVDWRTALFWGGGMLPPVLHLLFGLSIIWMVNPLVEKRTQPLLLLLVCVQPMVLFYNLVGRPDHQTLLMISAAVLLGYTIRAIKGSVSGLHAGFMAGLWAGFGLWVSAEFQFSLIIVAAYMGLLWLWRGEIQILKFLEGLALGFFLMVGAGVLAERGSEWSTARELDKISFSQLIGAALNCCLWGVTAWLAEGKALWRRGLALALCGVGALLGVMLLVPELLRGPAGDIDPRVMSEFFLTIREMRPLWPKDQESTTLMLACLGPCIWALLLWAGWGWRQYRDRAWWLLYTFSFIFTILGLMHARFSQFAEPFAVVLVIAVAFRVSDNLKPHSKARARLAEIGILFGPYLLAGIMIAATPSLQADDGTAACAVKPVSEALNKLPEGIIMAHLNQGPELLYFTHHSVVAGPYHRNTRGLIDSFDFFGTTDDATAHKILTRRGISYVLTCAKADNTGTDRLGRLARGEAPSWLKPLPLADSGDFKAYSVE